jgi:flagellar hook-associated protein FlgK
VTFANGTTFHESFAGLVNRMGSSSRQAELSKDALAVVHDQAVESREGIAGVNLDEEASNLVKFQQAYQASAKLIQTANTIFDSIIRI